MVRFSVGRDEDGNEERPSNNRPLPKRPRCNPIVIAHRRDIAAALFGGSPTTSTAAEVLRPEEPVAAQEESEDESSGESDTSWSHSSSESEGESEDESDEEQPNRRSGDRVQPTEARADSTPNENGTCRESEGPSAAISVTLMDPDVLDCPICYEHLCSPVYQCENGHIACASCCTIMKNKCASCCWPIGYNRCRAIEKVIESVRIACRNMPYGCTETLSYSKKQAHEKACSHTPCSCPYVGCDYVAVSKCLYVHFSLHHSSKQFSFSSVISISLDNTQKHVFLQESSQSTLFILNRSVETIGSFVNVVCVAPSSEKRAFLYELIATTSESSIKLKTFVDLMPKWTTQLPAKVRLLIPSDFISVSGVLNLELTIWRNPPFSS